MEKCNFHTIFDENLLEEKISHPFERLHQYYWFNKLVQNIAKRQIYIKLDNSFKSYCTGWSQVYENEQTINHILEVAHHDVQV